MSDEVDPEKKEQERIMRAMNKGGPRKIGAPTTAQQRPTSWNVHLSGRAVGGAASKNQQEEALRTLQEQIKGDDAFKIAVGNAASAEQPFQKKAVPVSPRAEIASPPPPKLEDQAEINAFNAFNEQRELERLNKWTRGGGGKVDPSEKKFETHFEKPVPAVLMRAHDAEATASTHQHAKPAEPVVSSNNTEHKHNAEYHDAIPKFSSHIAVAAKALKQENNSALISACFSVVVSAKVLAGLLDGDTEVISWAKALEGATNEFSTVIDSGRSGRELYNTLSNYLGQLYLSVVAND